MSVRGYARLHKNVTKVGSRLRLVTQKRNQGRFSVTHGYVKSQKRCVTARTKLCNRLRQPLGIH